MTQKRTKRRKRRSNTPPWVSFTLRTVLQVCIVTCVAVVVIVPVVVTRDSYRKSLITPPGRIRCLVDGANETQCTEVGCIWAPRDDAPSCYFPPASSHGYTISDAPPDAGEAEEEGEDGKAVAGEGGGGGEGEGRGGGGGETKTEGITKYRLDLKPSSATVVENLKTLQAEVIEYSDQLFRIKVTVPGVQRYEVPVPLDLPSPSSPPSPLYKVSLNSSGDFVIKVTRNDTNKVIFDTSIGGFTYAEQFLQVSTRLPSSNLYGLGEHAHASLKHNLAYKTWPMFARDQPPGKVGENLYGVHPMYMVVEDDGSSHAVLWLNSNAMEAETMPLPGLTLRSIGGIIDLFFFLGPSPEQVVQQYTSVIGRPFLPPYWSLGFQLCRYGYNSLDNLTAAVSRTRRHGIPQDVQYADIDHMDRRLDFTYDRENFAGLPDYIREVKAEGLRFIIILDPAINAEMPTGEYPVHETGVANDVYITWPEGEAPDENFGAGDVMLGYVWPDNRTAFPDFFRQKTRDWWKEHIVQFHKTLEFDGLWIDMNEPANFGTNEARPWNWPEERGPWSLACPPSPWDDPPYVTAAASVWGEDKRLSDKTLCMVARQGEERELRHYDVHSLYGWSETLPTLQALQAATGKRGIVVTRSTYPGSGRWAGHWLGDNTADWGHLGDSIIGMLEFNLFGIPYVGADICGFFGDANEMMCERWMELGAFYPFSRNHNHLDAIDHDPGLWPSVAASSRKALRIRYTLLPYLYTLHFLAATKGSTVVRPLFFEYPNIVRTWDIDDQFLWGSWLMIAPVIQHGISSRRVYFPRGIWYDYYNGAVFNQTYGTDRPVAAPRSHIPLFVRGGGILVTQRPRDNTAHSRTEPLGLIVAPDWSREASGTFFWDDGEGIVNSVHHSHGMSGEWIAPPRDFFTRRKIQSVKNRRCFLMDCLAEQVLPPSAPNQLKSGEHPFPDSARAFLVEAIRTLQHRFYELRNELEGDLLPHELVLQLQQEDQAQRAKHKAKLQRVCNKSRWTRSGRNDLLRNLSSRRLTQTEKEALSLGLKFSTGQDSRDLIDYVISNNRWTDSDLEKGFVQGITTCCMAEASSRPPAIPRRYIAVLKGLGADKNIVITQADKGGGIVVMDNSDYNVKMNDLLSDASVYRKVARGDAKKEGAVFKKKARDILLHSARGKHLLHLLEEAPRTPSMRGLPKIHKPGVPMRPITSGIGSAPHRLAKCLARPLSGAMGVISDSHLKNSDDLIKRLQNLGYRNKKLASFDVKALFTNVPTDGAIQAAERVVNTMDDESLPLPKRDFIRLVKLCVNFGSFEFAGEEYRQTSGLAMGSPLSAVLACIFMETLEKDHYRDIIGRHSTWLRYVDDVLVVVPRRTCLRQTLMLLNAVHDKIQFTVEEEECQKLPFLDTLIHRDDDGLRFSVYRKPTNKDDYIHYYSAHSSKTKSGVVIGFFLRALRICSPEFLEDEMKYIIDSFVKHRYPRGFLLNLRKKAENIVTRTENDRAAPSGFLILPQCNISEIISRYFGTNVNIANTSGVKIGDLARHKKPLTNNPDSAVYCIPCSTCEKAYYGETGRGFDTRITEHRADIRHHRTSNAMVAHVDEAGHLPNWKEAKIVSKGLQKQRRKVMEAAYIATTENMNTASGRFKLSKVAAASIMRINHTQVRRVR